MAAIKRGNVEAVQFHPEKSGGMKYKIVLNFYT